MAMDMAAIAKFFFCIASLGIFLNVAPIKAAPQNALVTHLPGFNGTFPSKHYAGYVTIESNKKHKNLFYYFVVSERSPLKDPVVLWLNGGPGCSSFDGFVYEHGPFNFQAGKAGQQPTLHLNPYSWSKVSNIIYLDSPAGVGYSYIKNETIYDTGDKQTASDTHKFLLQWFQQYPEFAPNPFFISGESYAGVYVPTLASEVVKGIKAHAKPFINFKGYMVGNGVTDEEFDGNALVPFTHGMGLISDEIFEQTHAACKGNYYQEGGNANCSSMLSKVDELIYDVNIYDILEVCYHGSSENNEGNGKMMSKNKMPSSFMELGKSTERTLPVRTRIFGRAWPFRAPVRDGLVPSWPQLMVELSQYSSSVPCTNDEVASAWLNNPAVRKALHAAPECEAGEWNLCTGRLNYNHDDGSMIPFHKNLTMQGYRALIYSGDHDMCVPFTGSEAWTRALGYKTVDEWRPWMTNDQVSGFLQSYDHNLTFLTIKGAGHTVPEYKPREALNFYDLWLQGQKI